MNLMMWASLSLAVSEMVLTEWRNSEDAEGAITSGSWNDTFHSWVLMESMKTVSRPYLKSSRAWFSKVSSQPGSQKYAM